MINKKSFTKAQVQGATDIDPKKLIKKLNKRLKKAPPKGQYDAIKDIINNREVMVLKREFGITERISSHEMRWALVNAYNLDQEDEE